MSAQRITLQPAFVLHRRDWRETSLLVEAFTAEYGRVGLVAKGVRRGKARLQGLLQPFRPLLLSWSGGGELRTLTDAESGGVVPPLSGRVLYSGFYLNELLLRLLQREDAHPALFAAYAQALNTLAADEEWTLRCFERDLLSEIGYGLALAVDAEGAAIDRDALYDYHGERGPVPTNNARHAVHGATLLALAGLHVPGVTERREAKRLLRAVLAPYLGERPLESRLLFQASAATQNNEEEA